MGFVTNISDFGSLAIVGLEKNTGKTECLNYILGQLGGRADRFALTSVGIDGESRDQVCQTAKPEIEIPEGMIFVTSEKHYREKRLAAEVLDVSLERTALGRLITARAKMSGKLLLSGPSDTAGLKAVIDLLKSRGVGTTIVDGALSRLSLASPAVTEAMILATGAAVAGNIPELVRKTKYVYELIGIEEIEEALRTRLDPLTQGVWAVSGGGEPIDLELPSVLMLERSGENLFRHGRRIYATGIVTDKLFQLLRTQQREVELIVRDFTRVFASPEAFYAFLRRGHRIRVVHRSRLLAVTVNPTAPSGLVLDSRRLCEAMQEALQIPVYDVKKMPE